MIYLERILFCWGLRKGKIQSMPIVSVVIPTFNRSHYLKAAIQSVLRQTYQDFEIIVVDDGSTDDTRKVVSSFGSRVLYFHQSNHGSPQARNVGLRLAKGKYLALLDCDDLFSTDRLVRGVEVLNQMPQIALVHGEVEAIDSEGKLIPKETAYIRKFYQKERKDGSGYLRILKGNAMFPSTILFRRECLNHAGFFNPAFAPREDYDWYLRLALEHQVYLLESPPVALYRKHKINQSSRYDSKAIARVYVAILQQQLTFISERLTPSPLSSPPFRGRGKGEGEYQNVRSAILAKLAEYYWTCDLKREVRTSLFEAIRLNPSIVFDPYSLKRLILSL